jgi:hypothetical protein
MHCLIDIMYFNVFLFESIHTLIRWNLSSENVKLLQCVVFIHHPVNCVNPWRASRTWRIPYHANELLSLLNFHAAFERCFVRSSRWR